MLSGSYFPDVYGDGLAGVPDLHPLGGRMQPRVAVNGAQHKIINLLKTLSKHEIFCVCDYMLQCI